MSIAPAARPVAAPAAAHAAEEYPGVHGQARLRVVQGGGASSVAELYAAQPLRLFIPKPGIGEMLTAVNANLSGGIVGGDCYRTEIALGPDAGLTLAAQAAEKVYRSTGAEARNDIAFSLADGAMLEWLPQGTIIFDRAIFRQTVRFDITAGTILFAGAISILGRAAMGERVSAGRYREQWDLYRDGRPLWLDRFDLRDPAAAAGPASAMRGVTCFATALFARPGAARELAWVREALARAGAAFGPVVRAGVTAIDADLLVLRWLGSDAMRLRTAVGDFWGAARARWLALPEQLPVIWRS